MRIEFISSAQNPKIKELLSLQEKSKMRREKSLFVVEGRREIERCIAAGFRIDTVFYCPTILGKGTETPSFEGTDARMVEIPKDLYAKVAYREGTEGIIAEVGTRDMNLEDIALPQNPLIVVLESVEKPGNLGAVLRSADAAGADAVIICDPLTDLYNPNLIRSSTGAIFSVPCVACSTGDAIAWLKEHGIQVLTAQLQDSELYYDTDMTAGTAIVIGTEATGLSETWREAADRHIRIPMMGSTDSLNASASAAILLYEAVRQRHA